MYQLHALVTHFWLKRNIYVAVSVPAGVSGRRRPRAEVTPDHAEASPVATSCRSRSRRNPKRHTFTHTRLDRAITNENALDVNLSA